MNGFCKQTQHRNILSASMAQGPSDDVCERGKCGAKLLVSYVEHTKEYIGYWSKLTI